MSEGSGQRIQPERVHLRNDAPARAGGRYVLYWMQQSQRAEDNHAFEYAAQRANERGLPLVVGFGLTAAYPAANRRHYRFLLEGLAETAAAVAARGAGFVLRTGDPAEVALGLAGDAALVVCDRGYLRHQRAWRDRVAREAGCAVHEVEADAVIPVGVVSDKKEYAARTLRPKHMRRWREWLTDLAPTPLARDAGGLDIPGLALADLDGLLDGLGVDGSVPPVPQHFRGGTSVGKARLRRFVAGGLARYAADGNQPQAGTVSGLSPYLHFGQVSPLWAARQVQASPLAQDEGGVAFLEQLLVRRELSLNFCWYEPRYDQWAALPDWARATLTAHRGDRREHIYTEAQLESAGTHDRWWNAAMTELRVTGTLHNYMRMYWGKKILEWRPDPEDALELLLRLNDRWLLDGRDPNSYAGALWIFGLHDRPWQERPVYGTVRCMTAGGLERKCDIRGYAAKVAALDADSRALRA
jgi:deoxyribodipyrimidine photo-lyase